MYTHLTAQYVPPRELGLGRGVPYRVRAVRAKRQLVASRQRHAEASLTRRAVELDGLAREDDRAASSGRSLPMAAGETLSGERVLRSGQM